MALEFDPTVNRYQAVSGYTKAAETGKTAEATKTSQKAAEAEAAEGKAEEKTDSVELSGDAKSVNKMSAEERAALVKSLKADQEYQMTRFINMMTQTFQKQGMTAKSAEDDSFWRMFASGNPALRARPSAPLTRCSRTTLPRPARWMPRNEVYLNRCNKVLSGGQGTIL